MVLTMTIAVVMIVEMKKTKKSIQATSPRGSDHITNTLKQTIQEHHSAHGRRRGCNSHKRSGSRKGRRRLLF